MPKTVIICFVILVVVIGYNLIADWLCKEPENMYPNATTTPEQRQHNREAVGLRNDVTDADCLAHDEY